MNGLFMAWLIGSSFRSIHLSLIHITIQPEPQCWPW